jgi:hypothetical protein
MMLSSSFASYIVDVWWILKHGWAVANLNTWKLTNGRELAAYRADASLKWLIHCDLFCRDTSHSNAGLSYCIIHMSTCKLLCRSM